MAETVIDFPKARPTPKIPSQGTGFELRGTPAPPARGQVYSKSEGGAAVAAAMEIDKLYPAVDGPKSQVVTALGLLADGITWLEAARTSIRANKLTDADRCVQRFETLLGPLFAQRTIGDGFASAINSLHFALVNQHGKPLTFDQLTTIWRVLKELRNGPFVPFDQSLSWIEELEDCGLGIDPPVLASLIEESEPEDSESE